MSFADVLVFVFGDRKLGMSYAPCSAFRIHSSPVVMCDLAILAENLRPGTRVVVYVNEAMGMHVVPRSEDAVWEWTVGEGEEGRHPLW